MTRNKEFTKICPAFNGLIELVKQPARQAVQTCFVPTHDSSLALKENVHSRHWSFTVARAGDNGTTLQVRDQ